jgi:hypothetical protein
MAGVEAMLRSMLEGRRRWWTVIILIALVMLVLGLPAVDDYIALRKREQELSVAYRAEQTQLDRREELAQRASTIDVRLAGYAARGLTDETVSEFRHQIVELTRGAGCQLRRLNLESVSYRPWLKDDHPLRKATGGRNRKEEEASATGFDLRSQVVSLSVSGKVADVQKLLAAVTSTGKLMQMQSLNLRPSASDRGEAVLEMQFTVFGLTKTQHKTPAA